jgi:hypothetical protein
MLHISTSVAAGIPPPCSTLLHCSYEPGAHLSMPWLLLGSVLLGALMLGVPLLLRRSSGGPDTGWWRWTHHRPDGPHPLSPEGAFARPRAAFARSHRRRARGRSVAHAPRVRSGSRHR